jgi:hypothetical protein
MSSQGILYIATGASYLAEARQSARSARRHHPELKIAVATDQNLVPDADFNVVLAAPTCGQQEKKDSYLARDRVAYYRKIRPLLESPFEKTLFLDSDTYIAAPLDDLFKLLDHFDLLVTPAHVVHDYAFERSAPPFCDIPAAFGYFNTGLVAYRRGPATNSFLHRWMENYTTHTAQHTVNDQPAFRLTLFQGIASFHVLPAHYNIISWVPFIVPAGGRIVMLHGRNPWLQKWVARFSGTATPTLVGPLTGLASFWYQAARVLNTVRRLKRRYLP